MEEIKLKNCPFCGAVPKIDEIKACTKILGIRVRAYVISCKKCKSSGPMELDITEAIKKWNERV